MKNGKILVCHITKFIKFAKITKENEKEASFESLGLLPLFSFLSICLGSNYDWNQFLMIRHIHISESQEPL